MCSSGIKNKLSKLLTVDPVHARGKMRSTYQPVSSAREKMVSKEECRWKKR